MAIEHDTRKSYTKFNRVDGPSAATVGVRHAISAYMLATVVCVKYHEIALGLALLSERYYSFSVQGISVSQSGVKHRVLTD